MNYCKSLWTKVSAKCIKCKCNLKRIDGPIEVLNRKEKSYTPVQKQEVKSVQYDMVQLASTGLPFISCF